MWKCYIHNYTLFLRGKRIQELHIRVTCTECGELFNNVKLDLINSLGRLQCEKLMWILFCVCLSVIQNKLSHSCVNLFLQWKLLQKRYWILKHFWNNVTINNVNLTIGIPHQLLIKQNNTIKGLPNSLQRCTTYLLI